MLLRLYRSRDLPGRLIGEDHPEPPEWGEPRCISEQEIRDALRDGWEIGSIKPERFETNLPFHEHGARAYLAAIRRASP